MRLIGTVEHEVEARRFAAFLSRANIENSIDPSFDPASNQFLYAIWIHNEDQIAAAADYFSHFQTDPRNAQFDVPIQESPPSEEESSSGEMVLERASPNVKATSFFLALCVFVFFLNAMQTINLREEGSPEALITPIQMSLFYDVPPPLKQVEEILAKYKIPADQKELPAAMKQEIEAAENVPFWRGIYAWASFKIKGKDTSQAKGPLFIKIREGEVWRLFSPAILHTEFLHILFNMLWLWMLGRQIEGRIGSFRYVLLTLFLGIATNTAQYLMSGPFFLGYSGIVMGLAGFIWQRERIAPWEGYPLQRSVVIFLAVFVLAMFALQFGSFLFFLFTDSTFAPNIANTAHVVGGIAGIVLGRMRFFARRSS